MKKALIVVMLAIGIILLGFNVFAAREWFVPGYGAWNDDNNEREYFVPGFGAVNEEAGEEAGISIPVVIHHILRH